MIWIQTQRERVKSISTGYDETIWPILRSINGHDVIGYES